MKTYTTKIAVYDASTKILIDTYTLTSVSRSQRVNDMKAMTNVKKEYRESRLTELANRYGDIIYKLVDDGIIEPLSRVEFDIL